MFELTKRELIESIIVFIVLSICFAISNTRFDVNAFISILPIVMIGVGLGTILHEFGHKFVAMKYGYRSEFKLWPIGLLIAFVTSFFGIVISVAGEARIFADDISDEIQGRISIAGPMFNIALALIFIVIAALVYPFNVHSDIFHLIYLICTVGFSVNSFLATFNLLPFYTLDGTKVLKWNAIYWIAAFAISASMMLISITIGPEKMVLLFMGG
ncbi:site-2 protease family protein [uncultured Methanobrevibacter sp.]|uniref:site-2 protease family protein n=1 Tax=uncultured Methanobrevibacter sp. TaxID=253161 RepID=UPI0025F44435|nr:site-2 protease family protein [uncultured Methanobrevibacter sp.]